MSVSRIPQLRSMGDCGEMEEVCPADQIDIDSFSDLQNEEEKDEEEMERKATGDEEEEEEEEEESGDGNGKGNIGEEEEGKEEKKKEYKLDSLKLDLAEETRGVVNAERANGAETMTDVATVDWRLANGITHPSHMDNNWILTDRYKKTFSSDGIMNDLSHHFKDDQMSSYTCSAVVDLLCALYAVFLSVVGCVLALANALTKDINEESYYLQAFYVYIYAVTVAFLIYLHAFIRRQRQQTPSLQSNTNNVQKRSQEKKNHCSAVNTTDNESCCWAKKRKTNQQQTTESRDLSFEAFAHPTTTTTTMAAILNIPMPPSVNRGWRNISFGAPGVNFYLRLGAIGFGTGSMIQDGFHLVQYIEDGQITFRCQGPFSVVTVVLHVVFVFLQTFFIFKYHKIVVNVHKAGVRFGLMHMVAANVCVWFATTVTECHRDLIVNSISSLSNTTTRMETNGQRTEASATCDHESTLVWKASPYLFPCTIEYSLIAAAVAYKMYRNVGCLYPQQQQQLEHSSSSATTTSSLMRRRRDASTSVNESVNCKKANKGLFVGLLVSVLTMIAVSCYFVFGDRLSFYGTHSSSILFFSTEILLLFVVFVGVVVAFFQFQRLHFIRLQETESKLDPSLLFISLAGVFSLESFHLVSSAASISFGQAVPLLALGCSVLAIAQSALQTVFIADALQRRARDGAQAEQKPGRSVVVFLLLCNLSLWIVCIFEVKKAENIPIHSNFYGSAAWSIIRDMCVPLIIFFRFHSTVCLSEIWINAYTAVLQEKGRSNY